MCRSDALKDGEASKDEVNQGCILYYKIQSITSVIVCILLPFIVHEFTIRGMARMVLMDARMVQSRAWHDGKMNWLIQAWPL